MMSDATYVTEGALERLQQLGSEDWLLQLDLHYVWSQAYDAGWQDRDQEVGTRDETPNPFPLLALLPQEQVDQP